MTDADPAPPPRPDVAPFIGDVIALLSARIGADRAAQWVAKKLGAQDCCCAARAAKLNELDRKLRKWLGIGSS